MTDSSKPFKQLKLDPTKQYEIKMLDQSIINLMQEIPAHKDLYARMREAERQGELAHSTIFEMPGDADIALIQNFDQAIGFLAAEVGLLLDGLYTYNDICNLCDVIYQKLVDRRAVYVNSPENSGVIVTTGTV